MVWAQSAKLLKIGSIPILDSSYGTVCEWLKQQPWKGCILVRVSRVRICPVPPMCYLCLEGSNNPFGIKDMSRASLDNKKARAKEIKQIILSLEADTDPCERIDEEIANLKEEQYNLAKEI